MSNRTKNKIIEDLIKSLDIPESAYEKAEARYKDVGDWFGRPESTCSANAPRVYPQGSFRLGTVIRPLLPTDQYDLDLGCRLRKGIYKSTHTQQELKELVGDDLEAYRKARRIETKLQEKNRCWRLEYQDELSFHMDVVPSIPESEGRRRVIEEAIANSGTKRDLAKAVAQHAGAITDLGHPHYSNLCDDWKVSNSEGYALWFEARMRLATTLMEDLRNQARLAQIDELPARKWRSPLQRCVQILKRHRDVWSQENPDAKPISVIITTLAALAYQGEEDVGSALERILSDMGNYVSQVVPRVPNPVNPVEDFADKWYDPKYRSLNLELNFWSWLKQAQVDYKLLVNNHDPKMVVEQAKNRYFATLSETEIRNALGTPSVNIITSPKTHSIAEPAKPWARVRTWQY